MFKPYAILCGAVSDALDALPAIPENVRARWLLELTRCRSGEAAEFDVEATDAEGRIAFSSGLADRSSATGDGRLGAAAG